MSIWHSPEREQLRKTVRAFAEREVLPHVDEWEQSGMLPRELHRQGGRGRPAGRRAARSRWRWRRRRRRRADHLRGDALRRCAGRGVRVVVHLRHRGAAHDRVRRSAIDRHLRATHTARRQDRIAGDHRTRRRVRRRASHHQGHPRRRRLHHQRRQDLHHLRRARRLCRYRITHRRRWRSGCFADRRRQGHTRVSK